MPLALEWFVFLIVLLHVGILAVLVYFDSDHDYVERTVGAPVTWLILGGFIGAAVVGVLGVYGTLPSEFAARGNRLSFLIHVVPPVAGGVALAMAAGNGRILLRLLRAAQADTGAIPDDADERVSVTGLVRPKSPGISPIFGREAVCWTWTLSLGWDDHDGWQTRDGGSGAVPFALDDGSGSVDIAPEGAHIELYGEEECIYDADAPQPGRVGRNLRSSVGGDRRKYEESIAVGGGLTFWLGIRWTAGYFGAPLPM